MRLFCIDSVEIADCSNDTPVIDNVDAEGNL